MNSEHLMEECQLFRVILCLTNVTILSVVRFVIGLDELLPTLRLIK